MAGLLRGMARTAVIAGTATAVSNRVSRRQAGRWAAQDQQAAQQYYQPQAAQPHYQPPAPQAPAAPADDMNAKLAQLKELGELRQAGVLSDDEFQQQKDRILNG